MEEVTEITVQEAMEVINHQKEVMEVIMIMIMIMDKV